MSAAGRWAEGRGRARGGGTERAELRHSRLPSVPHRGGAAPPPGIAASAPRIPLKGSGGGGGGAGGERGRKGRGESMEVGQGSAPPEPGCALGPGVRPVVLSRGLRGLGGVPAPVRCEGAPRRAAPLCGAFPREVLGSVQKHRGWQKEPRVWSLGLWC